MHTIAHDVKSRAATLTGCFLLYMAAAVCAYAQETQAPASATLDNLLAAYSAESNAHARYLAFARQAALDDYAAVASLFKATAFAEEVHMKGLARLIEKMGGTPGAAVETPVVKSTKENLEAAVAAETDENLVRYAAFLKMAEEENMAEAAEVFRNIRAADASHIARYEAILDNLENLQGLRKDFFVCPVCGYVLDVLTVKACPSCGAGRTRFKRR